MTYSSTEKKIRLFRAWTSRHPIWAAWQVTYRCNFRCRFCSYWHDELGRKPEPSVSQYADGARKLASFGTLLISMAGGEPLLRHDFPEIVRQVARFHIPFLTTNGWFVTPQIAEEIMASGIWGVSVSIDYADAATHDAKRGMDGAWQQAWRAVEMLVAARRHSWQRVNVIAVLMNDNLSHIEHLLQMAAKRKAYFMVQPYSELKTGSKSHTNTSGQVSKTLLELHERHKNFLSNRYFLAGFDRLINEGGIPGCKAGRAFFNIDSAGDVAICVENKTRPVANLYEHDANTIHKRLLEASKKNSCSCCWYNCRGEVENLYKIDGLIQSLPTYFFDRGIAEGKMGRWK